MSALRESWPVATPWQRAIMLAFTALFARLLQMGLQSTGPGVWPHVLIPPFGLWLYATLAALANRRSLDVSPDGLTMANGPIPLRRPLRVARRDVAFAYHAPVLAVGDLGDTAVLWHTAGIETRGGRQIQLFGTFKDEESSRTMARRIAVAFGMPNGAAPIDARPITALREDPSDRRVGIMWTGLTVAALIAGLAWEMALRI